MNQTVIVIFARYCTYLSNWCKTITKTRPVFFWIEYFVERKLSAAYKYWWDQSKRNSTGFNIAYLNFLWWSQIRFSGSIPVILASMRYNLSKNGSSHVDSCIGNGN